jgi:hypothetical protein
MHLIKGEHPEMIKNSLNNKNNPLKQGRRGRGQEGRDDPNNICTYE